MSNSALNELGFAEFVAKLISDTFDAILSSQVDQKNKMAELYTLLSMEQEAFIDLCMEDKGLLDQLHEQLQDLFDDNSEIGHLVQEGSAYQPKTKSTTELPAYKELLNVTLLEKVDYTPPPAQQKPASKARFVLLPAGVNKIKRAIMTGIGEQQRAAIDSMMTDGIPRLVVDSGKINAKLTFATELFDDDKKSEGSSTPDKSVVQRPLQRRIATSSRFIGAVDTKRLMNSRLIVNPASSKAPQDAQSKANIYSEVEIHFKTIL